MHATPTPICLQSKRFSDKIKPKINFYIVMFVHPIIHRYWIFTIESPLFYVAVSVWTLRAKVFLSSPFRSPPSASRDDKHNTSTALSKPESSEIRPKSIFRTKIRSRRATEALARGLLHFYGRLINLHPWNKRKLKTNIQNRRRSYMRRNCFKPILFVR